MVRSLVVVSAAAGFLASASCFLLDQMYRPPNAAKRTTAINSPFGFMGYLRFHQVARPQPTTPSGKMTILSQNRVLSFWVVILNGWSSGALGRMEMRSSSEESQLMELTNRSRLPSWRVPANWLVAHSEVPTTTKRP